jgi:hypothetical protein
MDLCSVTLTSFLKAVFLHHFSHEKLIEKTLQQRLKTGRKICRNLSILIIKKRSGKKSPGWSDKCL